MGDILTRIWPLVFYNVFEILGNFTVIARQNFYRSKDTVVLNKSPFKSNPELVLEFLNLFPPTPCRAELEARPSENFMLTFTVNLCPNGLSCKQSRENRSPHSSKSPSEFITLKSLHIYFFFKLGLFCRAQQIPVNKLPPYKINSFTAV